MLNNHKLYDRKLIVRFDQTMGPTPEELDALPSRYEVRLTYDGFLDRSP